MAQANFRTALLDILMPRHCIVCDRDLSMNEEHICAFCLADLPRTGFSQMRRNPMSERFNALVQNGLEGKDLEHPVPYSYAASLFYYRPGTGYRDITRRLKYHSDLSAGRYFAGMLGREMAESPLFSDVDAVVPVPLHWTRKWSRGYNQAEVIAKVLSSALGVGHVDDILVRQRRTRTQTRLDPERKISNVSGAFRLRKGAKLSGYGHILLVDDVFTTGGTLHSCYEALRESCPEGTRISVATLAFVGS